MGHCAPEFCLGHGADFPAGARHLTTRGNIWTEGAPGSGRSRRNPGLNAREKLSPMMAEAEKAASNLHAADDVVAGRGSQITG